MSEPIDVLKNISATLNGRDIVHMSNRIIIAEDMNSSMTRSLIEVGRDSRYEMQEALAGNPLKITVQPQNGPSLTCNHVVLSAKPQMHSTAKGLQGIINGVDEDYKNMINKRITKGWKQKNTDAVIKEVHQEMGSKKKIEVSPGFKQATFTSPTLMPKQVIDKAGSLSQAGEKGKGWYYTTNKDGGTAYFKTLKDLSSQGPKRTFNFRATGASDPNTLGDPTVVFDLQYEGSSVSNQKQTEAQGQRYNPQYGKTEKNDASGRGLSTPGLGVQSEKAMVGFPVINSIEQNKENRHIDRDQQNLNDYSSKLKILVPIATDLHVGDVIQVNSGSATYFSDASPNNAASGKWMIVSLIHNIDLGGTEETPGHTGRTLLHCIGKIS